MAVADDWGFDPSVRMMRRVFGRIERVQGDLLKRLSISSFDPRLRRWREKARDYLERCWVQASRLGIEVGEEQAACIYAHCLTWAMNLDGIKVPRETLPKDEKIEILLKEVLR
ncbi:MAG: hypothetical protein JSW56_00030 [Deltaproteobacteria bacterium]|nr:MAG: hypothetical protein JSW56_00030 [Deltaproteobacteria bacterium]